MKNFIIFISGLILGLSIMYFLLKPQESLLSKLESHGISTLTITKMIAVGDESSGTQGKRLIINEQTWKWIWETSIETATPYVHKSPSGYRRLEIYSKQSDQSPAVTLLVNETDFTKIEGQDEGFICRGLDETLLQGLTNGKF